MSDQPGKIIGNFLVDTMGEKNMQPQSRSSVTSALTLAALLALPGTGMAQHAIFDSVNKAAAALGHDNVQLAVVEWITAGEAAGQTVFFNDRGNKQLGADWVPADPRNDIGLGTSLPWAIDGVEVTQDVPPAADILAIQASMQTWQDEECSFIPLVDLGLSPFDYGFVQFLIGQDVGKNFGGTPFFFPFLIHAGFIPRGLFDALTEDGGDFILGVAFTLIWVDDTGTPTDVDNNKKFDVAVREIYYNDEFDWGDGTNDTFDIETVALHEAGHGLSQAHFGKLFRTDANGRFHFSPRAVMNAGYTGVQRNLTATDTAGHCSNWGSWPNN